MEAEDFDITTALTAADALQRVFARRTHKKKFMGQEVLLPGQLGEAVRLPAIIAKLQSKVVRRREGGLEQFRELWMTLSEGTREQVLLELGWYDPKELDWDDKRSNLRPSVKKVD